jgi:hypothetical protein
MTWADIKGKSLGDAQKTIRQYVDAHWELYRSHPKPANHGAPPDREKTWEAEFRTLDGPGQATFIQQMWSFLEHHDSGAPPHA